MSFSESVWKKIYGTFHSKQKLAEEYLKKAQSTTDRDTVVEYLHKALECDSDCLEAEYFLAVIESNGDFKKCLEESQKVLEHGEKLMRERGFLPDQVGRFWDIEETRPYMRVLDNYADILISRQMYDEAIKIQERMIELNPGDNQGVRWTLSHLYAMTLDEEGAEKLLNMYPDDASSVHLMGHAELYYRLNKPQKVKEILRSIKEINIGFGEFVGALGSSNRLNAIRAGRNPYGIAIATADELVYEYDTYAYVYEAAKGFERWLKKIGPTL